MLDPITTEIIKVGVSESTKLLFSKVLNSKWLPDIVKGKNIVQKLDENSVRDDYINKYVSRFMKIRTIHSSEKDIMLDDIYHPLVIKGTKIEVKVEDEFIISNNDVTNIIGFAGQGKSTILRKLLLEIVKHGNKIPFFMELRKIEKTGIKASLNKQLLDIGILSSDEELNSLLSSGYIVLLLDGFDEISSDYRDKILHEIIEINNLYKTQIITTSRDGTEICNEAGIVNFRVNRIKRADIISIIKKLSSSNEVEMDTLPQIFGMLKNNDTLVDTLNSPLLVTLFYICYPHLDSIPNNAIEFYSKLFTTLYFRHDKIKNFKRERKSSITPADAFNCFCAFCFKSLFDNKYDFTYYSLIGYISQSLKISGTDEYDSEDVASDFIDITCLIQKDGYDRYVFLHKSVQEYHAAEYVKSLNTDRKKSFMDAVLKSIKVESKLIATARYLYEIDRENTFSMLCLPICYEMKLDKYEEDKIQFIEELYDSSTKNIKINLAKRLNGEKPKNRQRGNPFSDYITSIGPFNEPLKNLIIFSRYYTGENSRGSNQIVLDAVIKKSVLDSLYTDKDLKFYESKTKEDIDLGSIGFVYLKDLSGFLKIENKIKEKMRVFLDNIYNDVYLNNLKYIKQKDEAIKSLFNFL
ncbi:NACHT domain-containing protein [Providencia sp. PROV216]|uniref:NACHT domain-containing protein n=1 Tax=Providencia sp. PROV216 TaxID=2949912 RepID=UPI0023494971|nr:NACHT domain-containing protein [Providencia sp. PROV216]